MELVMALNPLMTMMIKELTSKLIMNIEEKIINLTVRTPTRPRRPQSARREPPPSRHLKSVVDIGLHICHHEHGVRAVLDANFRVVESEIVDELAP